MYIGPRFNRVQYNMPFHYYYSAVSMLLYVYVYMSNEGAA